MSDIEKTLGGIFAAALLIGLVFGQAAQTNFIAFVFNAIGSICTFIINLLESVISIIA